MSDEFRKFISEPVPERDENLPTTPTTSGQSFANRSHDIYFKIVNAILDRAKRLLQKEFKETIVEMSASNPYIVEDVYILTYFRLRGSSGRLITKSLYFAEDFLDRPIGNSAYDVYESIRDDDVANLDLFFPDRDEFSLTGIYFDGD